MHGHMNIKQTNYQIDKNFSH